MVTLARHREKRRAASGFEQTSVGDIKPILSSIHGLTLGTSRPWIQRGKRACQDRRWHELLDRYLGAARRQLDRFRGRKIDVAGDGLFAIFDGPARAIRCACAIRDAVRQLGLEVRAGLHTGECEMAGSKVSGIAVHTGARIAAAARPQEVLASGTVRDLVAGSGIQFDDRGSHTLKGVPGDWRLFAVTST